MLDLVVGRLLKEKDQWDSENTDEKRTLQNINKIATSKEVKKGNCLLSLFAYYHSKIGKEIKTDNQILSYLQSNKGIVISENLPSYINKK